MKVIDVIFINNLDAWNCCINPKSANVIIVSSIRWYWGFGLHNIIYKIIVDNIIVWWLDNDSTVVASYIIFSDLLLGEITL